MSQPGTTPEKNDATAETPSDAPRATVAAPAETPSVLVLS